MVRRRGNSFHVVVYAGQDPLTGRTLYLRESTTDEAEARRILRRLSSQIDEQRHARTNASFRVAMEAWLRTHEVEETTRASYEQYARVHLYPAFGDEPVGKSVDEVARGVLRGTEALQRPVRRHAGRRASDQPAARVPGREAPAAPGSAAGSWLPTPRLR